jgi:hypothetical protein
MAARDRSRLSFTSSSDSEDEAEKEQRLVLKINESTGRYEFADPEVRAAQDRHDSRVQARKAVAAKARRDARAIAALDAHDAEVKRQVERERTARNPRPQSFEEAAAHLHDTQPVYYNGKEEVYWHVLERGFLSTRWNDEHFNSYNPVVVDNYVVMVPHGATAGEHRFVFPTWDLNPMRYRARGYGCAVQQWSAMRLNFGYGFPRRHPTPSPEHTPSGSECEQDEDDGNY